LRKYLIAAFFAIACLRVSPLHAQDGGPNADAVRVRIGPLMMNPTISLTNLGIDHNVFNDPPDKVPKQDFTFTVTPNTDFWLRAGSTWITGSLNESINWYQRYSSERTANNEYKLGWNAPTSHIGFKINGSYISARERPGFEIDTRAARKETLFTTALDFKGLPKTYVGVTASRQQTRFANEAEYLGVNLQEALNRITTSYGLALRYQATPLTTFNLSATRSTDGFEFSSDRDTTSTGIQVNAAFAPAALIKGNITFGYTDFKPKDPSLPQYKGAIGEANLTYVLLGASRFAFSAGRGVQYSYDANQPYYLQTHVGGSIAQQLFGPFDVQVRGDYAILAYRDRIGAALEVTDRTDHKTTYGVGVGFHMGRDLRLSVNADQDNRQTKVAEHQYEKFLVGTSLTYGF
jgi:hypothetical protein